MADMRTLSLNEIGARIDIWVAAPDEVFCAQALEATNELLTLGESILEIWLRARGETPTEDTVAKVRVFLKDPDGWKAP